MRAAALQLPPVIVSLATSQGLPPVEYVRKVTRLLAGHQLEPLLNTWSVRDYFKFCARGGVPKQEALRQSHRCRRCLRSSPWRVTLICFEEYQRLEAGGKEAAR